MHFAILNGALVDNRSVQFDWQNRAFQFGDGFFETILFFNGEPRLFQKHFLRINKAFNILGFESNPSFSEKSLKQEVHLLCHVNALIHCRIKIIFWRNWGGLYSPEIQTFNYLILTYPAKEPKPETISRIGISRNIHNLFSPTSGFKSLNSLKYVLAGKEMGDNNWQDIILLDNKNHVSEALHSNIFCIKNDVFYTPSDQSGCINGVMRAAILESLSNNDQLVKQELFDVGFLLNCDSVYLCNISGIKRVDSWNNIYTFRENSFFEKLRKSTDDGYEII